MMMMIKESEEELGEPKSGSFHLPDTCCHCINPSAFVWVAAGCAALLPSNDDDRVIIPCVNGLDSSLSDMTEITATEKTNDRRRER